MGGLGSGRSGSLPVIENGLKLDLRRMRKLGQFVPGAHFASGNLVWSYTHSDEQIANIGYSFCSTGDDPWFRVQYTTTPYGEEPQKIDEKFNLERFPQPYGGHRWYFICLQYGKARAVSVFTTRSHPLQIQTWFPSAVAVPLAT